MVKPVAAGLIVTVNDRPGIRLGPPVAADLGIEQVSVPGLRRLDGKRSCRIVCASNLSGAVHSVAG